MEKEREGVVRVLVPQGIDRRSNAGFGRKPRSEVRGGEVLRRLNHSGEDPSDLSTNGRELAMFSVRDVAAVVGHIQ